MKQSKSVIILLIFNILIMISGSCTLTEDIPEIDNPYNPDDSTNFIPPETFITLGPVNYTVVNTHTVTVGWTGNEGIQAYSFSLNGSNWSSWSPDTTVTYTYLDEGEYIFAVIGRYTPSVYDTSAAVSIFTVDDIQGPALWFQPRKIEVQLQEIFDIYLTVEDATDMLAFYANIQYDSTQLELVDITVLEDLGEFLTSTNGSVIDLIDYPVNGRVEANLAVTNANPPGVDGSGKVMKWTFRGLSPGQTEISISSDSKFINSALEEVPLLEHVSGLVEVMQ